MIKNLSVYFKTKDKFGQIYKSAFAFIILTFLCIVIYSNSIGASWHFDDYENILENTRVQIKDIQPATLSKTFFASPEGKPTPYRSVAYFSFAINAYFGGKEVVGYHIVNIAVHLITALILFLTVLKLFETPKLKGQSGYQPIFIAFLTAALWAVNPIQTQAVTYIVQRMASMAAMFCIIGLYFYLSGRLAARPIHRFWFFTFCGGSYCLAVLSKENAALLPLSLLFAEFIFFRDCRNPKEMQRLFFLLAVGTVAVIVLAFVLVGNPFGFINGYPNRTFTPLQRLLTETRVLIHYLSQIFYPAPTRLSLYHDFTVSKSLFHPWTTLPSMTIILLLISLGLKWMSHRPILSFAILFFFVNHLIESTVIGLELVFEHRNYLPSLFLFMPVAVGLDRLIAFYGRKNRAMQRILVFAVLLVIVGFGTGTFIRNQAWANEKTLWEDTLSKAPNSIRAHHELAYQYYEKSGNYDAALMLYHQGLKCGGQNIYEKTLSLNNIASIHFTRGEYNKAEYYWKEAIASYPKYKQAYYRLALTQTRLDKWSDADETLTNLIEKRSCGLKCSQLKGIILLKENNHEHAAEIFKNNIKNSPRDWQNLMLSGVAFSMTGNIEKANFFLRLAEAQRPREPLIALLLAKNSLISGSDDAIQSHLDKFITLVGVPQIQQYLHRVKKHYSYINFSLDELQPLIQRKINKIESGLFGDKGPI